MIRGYNFPSGSEKVSIDGQKATELLDLYTFKNQVVLDIKALPNSVPDGYKYQGELYDGSKLYMQTTLTKVTDDSSNLSSTGCTGTVLLIKPDGTQLSVEIPTYTIPDRNKLESSSTNSSYTYDCNLCLSPDNEIYLRIQRCFTKQENPISINEFYQSIYKLNINSSSLSWTTKVIEATLGENIYAKSEFIIENNYIYVYGYSRGRGTGCIYGYKFEDISYTFQTLSDIDNDVQTDDSFILVRKGTNTYICFYINYRNILTGKWIAITRNSDGNHSSSKSDDNIITSLGTLYKKYKIFVLGGDVYAQLLGRGGNEGYEGLKYYKFNDNISNWEEYINFSDTATTYTTEIISYMDGSPKYIFQGRQDSWEGVKVNDDGTFGLSLFVSGSLDFKNIQTPKINNFIGEWHFVNYICNNKNHQAFFFSVDSRNGGYGDGYFLPSHFKCVIKPIDDNEPILYSTFKESEITG